MALRTARTNVGEEDTAGQVQVVVTSVVSGQETMLASFASVATMLRLPTIVLALDTSVRAASSSAVVLGVTSPGSLPLARKWSAIAAILGAGAAIFLADVSAARAPTRLSHRPPTPLPADA